MVDNENDQPKIIEYKNENDQPKTTEYKTDFNMINSSTSFSYSCIGCWHSPCRITVVGTGFPVCQGERACHARFMRV